MLWDTSKVGSSHSVVSVNKSILNAVGGIIVWDKACLWSLVLWARAYHQDRIIFGISFYI